MSVYGIGRRKRELIWRTVDKNHYTLNVCMSVVLTVLNK